MNECLAANEHGEFRDSYTAAGDGESGGWRCRGTAAAPGESCSCRPVGRTLTARAEMVEQRTRAAKSCTGGS